MAVIGASTMLPHMYSPATAFGRSKHPPDPSTRLAQDGHRMHVASMASQSHNSKVSRRIWKPILKKYSQHTGKTRRQKSSMDSKLLSPHSSDGESWDDADLNELLRDVDQIAGDSDDSE